jgi:hypothetical protein
MSDRHLANTIRLIERNAANPLLTTAERWVGDDGGDFYPVLESLTPAQYLELVGHQNYVDEAKRRLRDRHRKPGLVSLFWGLLDSSQRPAD